ncbi:MAG: orotate phosphoribosyltransferase [Rhodospirillales bacterium]|jgi:orotate phosphoribosyltransferase|nr:orotate phosphoribosyltransferase [Rhodospirillales bacterium]
MTEGSNPPVLGADPETARLLLRIGAVGVRPAEPFRFTSGWASPVYIDCRRLISYPRERRHVIDGAVDLLSERLGWETIDAVAGGETAGIPYAAWLAEATGKPMLYVRKQAKGFGRNARIEGAWADGARVLLVEDLATDGASKLGFATALRDGSCRVSEAFVVFYYGIFPEAQATLAAAGLNLHFLATWWDVLAAAEAAAAFPAAELAEVRAFLADPVSWSAAHGGRAAP